MTFHRKEEEEEKKKVKAVYPYNVKVTGHFSPFSIVPDKAPIPCNRFAHLCHTCCNNCGPPPLNVDLHIKTNVEG